MSYDVTMTFDEMVTFLRSVADDGTTREELTSEEGRQLHEIADWIAATTGEGELPLGPEVTE